MSYFQATIHTPHSMLTGYRPLAGLGRAHEILYGHSLCPHVTRSSKLKEQVYTRLVLVSACHKRLGPVYASSGKENPKIVNDVSSLLLSPGLYLSFSHFKLLSCSNCFFLPTAVHTSHLLCYSKNGVVKLLMLVVNDKRHMLVTFFFLWHPNSWEHCIGNLFNSILRSNQTCLILFGPCLSILVDVELRYSV